MKHLFDEWASIQEELKDKKLLLFLDFDGTLAPIAPTPDEAVLPKRTKRILDLLSRSAKCEVTIVSGRALKNVKKKAGLSRVSYVGNHGFEIGKPNAHFKNNCFSKVRKIFPRIIENLKKQTRGLPGILLEDKDVTLSVHYRLVEKKKQAFFERVFKKIVDPFLDKGEIRACKGKKVFEIRPAVEWGKGKAILWLMKEHALALKERRAAAFFVGDDATDEEAFKALRGQALTVRVGKPKTSAARYYLDDVDQVRGLLSRILKERIKEQ